MRAAAAVALLGATLLLAQVPERPPRPFPEAREAYEEARSSEDPKRLAAALGELARSGLLSEDVRDKSFARLALKGCLRHRDPDLRLAAVAGYAKLRLPGSARDLRGVIREGLKGRERVEIAVAAVESWGTLGDPGSHGDLLDLLEDISDEEHHRTIARAAAGALGMYRPATRRERGALLADFMRTFGKLYGAAHRRVKDDSPQVRWWNAVERSMVSSFNRLAGQNCEAYYECNDWWLENGQELRRAKD